MTRSFDGDVVVFLRSHQWDIESNFKDFSIAVLDKEVRNRICIAMHCDSSQISHAKNTVMELMYMHTHTHTGNKLPVRHAHDCKAGGQWTQTAQFSGSVLD
jgi:hypothetical protein